jgi:pimeloyl-ACP methyl ester carboxylesterase
MPHAKRLALVDEAFRSLPDRYLGADQGFDATYHIRLGDVGHVWEVRCTSHTTRVRKGTSRREPDVTISTDADTWMRLREGEFSGIEAFQRRLLAVRGNLDQAVAFEGLFRLPNGRDPLVRIYEVPVGRHRISTLTMGSGSDVLLLHGLGGTRASLFETAASLSRRYRVHAIDLPGFGSSSKPATGGYNARWFADIVCGLLDELEIPRAHLVGNSMGGRVAIEVGLQAPSRVRTLSMLAPSMAFRRGREWVPLIRLLRPELAALPHMLRPNQVRDRFWSLVSRPERLDPTVGDIAADEFLRTYRSRGARVAFYAAARQIYLEAPDGQNGFWTRLGQLQPPALFIWGSDDPLVPARFSRHVASVLPNAPQVVLSDCGHIPQIELPERTHALVLEFMASAGQSASAPQRLARSA